MGCAKSRAAADYSDDDDGGDDAGDRGNAGDGSNGSDRRGATAVSAPPAMSSASIATPPLATNTNLLVKLPRLHRQQASSSKVLPPGLRVYRADSSSSVDNSNSTTATAPHHRAASSTFSSFDDLAASQSWDLRDQRSRFELQALFSRFPIGVDLMAGKHSGYKLFHRHESWLFTCRSETDRKVVWGVTQFAFYKLRKEIALKKLKTYSVIRSFPLCSIVALLSSKEAQSVRIATTQIAGGALYVRHCRMYRELVACIVAARATHVARFNFLLPSVIANNPRLISVVEQSGPLGPATPKERAREKLENISRVTAAELSLGSSVGGGGSGRGGKRSKRSKRSSRPPERASRVSLMMRRSTGLSTLSIAQTELQQRLCQAARALHHPAHYSETLPLFPHLHYGSGDDDDRPLTVSEFHPLAVLGQGSAGKTILARHVDPGDSVRSLATSPLEPGQLFALKDLSLSTDTDRDFGARPDALTFSQAREELARWHTTRDHPFIANVVASFVTAAPTRLYLVMPFFHGGSLLARLRTAVTTGRTVVGGRHHGTVRDSDFRGLAGGLQEEDACVYLLQVCMALEFLHARGMRALDLNPRHIVLDGRGYVRLTNIGGERFGAIDPSYQPSLCLQSSNIEKIMYLAPELLAHKHWAHPIKMVRLRRRGFPPTVDMWSLGCLAYELLVGFPPFATARGAQAGLIDLSAAGSAHGARFTGGDAPPLGEVRNAIRAGAFHPPSHITKAMSQLLCGQLLQRLPRCRPQTIADVWKHALWDRSHLRNYVKRRQFVANVLRKGDKDQESEELNPWSPPGFGKTTPALDADPTLFFGDLAVSYDTYAEMRDTRHGTSGQFVQVEVDDSGDDSADSNAGAAAAAAGPRLRGPTAFDSSESSDSNSDDENADYSRPAAMPKAAEKPVEPAETVRTTEAQARHEASGLRRGHSRDKTITDGLVWNGVSDPEGHMEVLRLSEMAGQRFEDRDGGVDTDEDSSSDSGSD